ncbi:MAG: hypothetical protein IPL93_01060 [Actinomycetales bacterium]|nr:hypothetical protein [Actinomycetales bacterium]
MSTQSRWGRRPLPGSNITYRLYSQNTGNSTLTDYTVIDTLPLDAAGNPVLTNVYVARSGSGSPLPDDGAQVTLSWSTDGVTWTNSVLISQGADLPGSTSPYRREVRAFHLRRTAF